MNISPFKVEEWMNAYETQATINIAETCVNSVSLDELFALTGENKQAFLNAFCQRRLTYGDIVGKPELREGICDLFKTLRPDEVATTHGAAGANHLAMYALIRPGDHVVCVLPTYQQLYSIPQSFGAQGRSASAARGKRLSAGPRRAAQSHQAQHPAYLPEQPQ